MKPKFNVGDRVKFKDHVFTDKNYTPYFDAYKGHEFIVEGYMPDEGVEITDEGCKPFKNEGVLYDHIGLICCTGKVQVNGYVHDCDLEVV